MTSQQEPAVATLLQFADGKRLNLPSTLGRTQIRSAVVAKEAALVEAVSVATDANAAAWAAAAAVPGVHPIARLARLGAGPIAVMRTGVLKGYTQLGAAPGTVLYLCEGDEVLMSPASAGAAGRVRVVRGALPAPPPKTSDGPRGRGRPKGSTGIKKRVRNEFGVLVPRESLEAGGGASSMSGSRGGTAAATAATTAATTAAAAAGLRSVPSDGGPGGASSRLTCGAGGVPAEPAGAAAAAPPAPPVMLLLVGLPGAGKSHFAHALLARAPPGAWTRVNQDSAGPRPGSPGTRASCVASASAALKAGRSVIVDRCNLDPGQRADFIAAATAAGVPVHAVVLDVPARECAARAAGRSAHEGGLEGPRATSVVGRMAVHFAAEGPPAAGPREGLATVTLCASDAEAAAVVNTWASRGGGGGGGAGGRRTPLSPASPLRPPRPSAFAALVMGPPRLSAGVGGGGGASGVGAGPGSAFLPAAATAATTTGGAAAAGAPAAAPNVSSPPAGGGGGGGGAPTAPPPPPTDKAAAAAPAAATAAEEAPTPTPVGDAAPIRKPSDLPGPPAPLPAAKAGVHVGLAGSGGSGGFRPALPPRKKGKAGAAVAAPAPAPPLLPPPPPPPPATADAPPVDVAGVLAAAIQAAAARGQGAGAGAAAPPRPADPAAPPSQALPPGWPEPPPVRAPRTNTAHPVHALWNVAADPGAHAAAGAQLVLPPPTPETGGWAPTPPCAGLVVLPDLFPKASVHGLVLVHGRSPPPTPFHLGPGDAALVRAMAVAGRAWLAARGVPPPAQRVGFHSAPSLQPLHMHALSADLEGACMRTKKHYLSFQRPFFVPADDVAAALEAGVPPPLLSPEAAAAAVRVDLACEFCGTPAYSVHHLKEHLAGCARRAT